MKNLKNWMWPIVFILFTIADQGFDFINPFLIIFGVSDRWINIIKTALIVYGLVKVKMDLPTQNMAKLQDIVKKNTLDDFKNKSRPTINK